MSKKHIQITIDTEKLTETNRTALIEMAGREALNKALSDDPEILFTEEEVSKMSEAEYEQKREAINEAMANGQVA